MEPNNFNDWLFPYDNVRLYQKEMIQAVISCLEHKTHAIIHAPTGLGKTVSTLAPALAYAIKHKKVIFFLTSRHTQHHIVIDTLREIKKKYDTRFIVSDIIGKKWMCIQPSIDFLQSADFTEYCKALREQEKCTYYLNARDRQKLTVKAAALLGWIKEPIHIDEFMSRCRAEEVCPYELAIAQSAKASVIVADYNYVFNPTIRNKFFAKTGLDLKDCIIIIDEGHNLPERMRDMLSHKISTFFLRKAMSEAKKYNCNDAFPLLEKLYQILASFAPAGEECIITKESFVNALNSTMDYDEVVEQLSNYGDIVRSEQKTSMLGSIASFLEDWPNGDEGYARILSKTQSKKGDLVYTLSKRCLDASLVTREPIVQSYCTFVMSGTMTPTSMYKELLGFPEGTKEYYFNSPFPSRNRLSLIIPETTTRYAERSPLMYQRIAHICAAIVNQIPGNTVLFFPSYAIRNEVAVTFNKLSKKTVFTEMQNMQKEEKHKMIERFSRYKDVGAVLLGVASGNFSEGIDMPGVLKCVIIVGLPLQRPDLEVEKLIEYYDKRFKKGRDYGYIFPAFTKCIQGAGRAIRTENDRGILIFLDERFSQPYYRRYFPSDWNIITTKNYVELINSFFTC